MDTFVVILILVFILQARKVNPPTRKNISTVHVKSNQVIELEIVDFPTNVCLVLQIGQFPTSGERVISGTFCYLDALVGNLPVFVPRFFRHFGAFLKIAPICSRDQ